MKAFARNVAFELVRDEEGASMVEYILAAVLIGVAAIFGMNAIGSKANLATAYTGVVVTTGQPLPSNDSNDSGGGTIFGQ